jgi:hypothetical protein
MYIGMTDVPSADWLARMLTRFMEAGGAEGERQLHAGVMMSFKSLNGLESEWSAVWPKNSEVAGIFVKNPFILNTLHYADYQGQDVAECLERAVDFGGPNLDAIQLDMIWPEPAVIRTFADRHPLLRIILQVGSKALEKVDDDPETLIERLKHYGEVEDVLLDRSGGKGIRMEAALLEPFIYELRARRPDLGITLAGGLGPETLHLVEPLVRKFPELSIDAQGKLRASGRAQDPIDWPRADEYLRKAIAMFRAP